MNDEIERYEVMIDEIERLKNQNNALQEHNRRLVKELQTIVRCKDCRHGWYDDDIEYYVCRHPKGLNEELYGVDFCSYGERREE